MIIPRKSQEEIMRYRKGRMGITAVPGSGKTFTLSMLAANLICSDVLQDDQEILIVTLANSAVRNFSLRIEKFLTQRGLLPGLNYRVRTLHGLAHDIVRERPSLVGLSDQFQIADEYEINQILEFACQLWRHSNPDILRYYASEGNDPYRNSKSIQDWQKLILDSSKAFIRQAKDLQVTPGIIRNLLNQRENQNDFLDMGLAIYSTYQDALNYRGAVDFDDLIRFALQALQTDSQLLARLQYRWPYILEDEAQDSSLLQEKILRALTGKHGSWVRVGDPNQAIYESFTTANPKYLMDFCTERGVTSKPLMESSRSSKSIIDLANDLVDWAHHRHPVLELRSALSYQQIKPAAKDDPNPNPEDNPDGIFLHRKGFAPDEELDAITRSLAKWLPAHPDETVAVLSLTNERGAKLVDRLKQYQLDYVELLQSSLPTRKTADLLRQVLQLLTDPDSSSRLADTYQAIRKYENQPPLDSPVIKMVEKAIRGFKPVENFLYNDDIQALGEGAVLEEYVAEELEWFKSLVVRWHQAVLLPIDQIILTISQDIFHEAADLALGHKLALYLENIARLNPNFILKDFIDELGSIAKSQRKFSGFSEDDLGFDPEQHKGKVVVTTYHKAKGLEWDRVYLTSVNNYDFPSGMDSENYKGEKWFVRDHLNFQAECVSALKSLFPDEPVQAGYQEGAASLKARLDVSAERLRLFYVGITRAKKELVITWNKGKSGAAIALSFAALLGDIGKNDHDNTA